LIVAPGGGGDGNISGLGAGFISGRTSRRAEQTTHGQIAHERAHAESPGWGQFCVCDEIGKRTERIAGYRHHVPHMMGEALTGRVAILNRCKHCSQEQDRTVRIRMMRTEHVSDQVGRVAADPRHGAAAIQNKTVGALYRQRHLGLAHIVERKGPIEETQERSDRRRGVVVLCLAEQQGRAAFNIAQIDIVTERRADDFAA
jgi:hypothetical protein